METTKQPSKTKLYFKKYWQLYAMLALPIIYLIVFKYVPMVYIQIAFKDYKIGQSVWEMPWAADNGLAYFKQAFSNPTFLTSLKNTFVLNIIDLIVGFPVPIIFALILNELTFKRFKKVTQTIAYMPHFLSWVIIYGLALQLFAPTDGFVNQLIHALGHDSIPFLNEGVVDCNVCGNGRMAEFRLGFHRLSGSNCGQSGALRGSQRGWREQMA